MADTGTDRNLSEAAFDLAEEIRDGKWDHLDDFKRKPAPACEEIVAELARCCPGYSQEQYRKAIATGLFESR